MMEPTKSRPDLAAYRRSTELTFGDLVRELATITGKKLIAYVGRAKQVRIVDGWINGVPVNGDSEDRVVGMYRIASMLAEHVSPSVAQRWLTGMNPDLQDEVAIDILRNGDRDARRRVLGAAITFIAVG